MTKGTTRRGGAAAVLALVAALGACDDREEPIGPTAPGVEIAEEVVRLLPGEEHTLVWQGGSEAGVTWRVRQGGVASVGADRVVRAIAPGMTWAVAERDGDADSVRVVVSFESGPRGALAFTLGEESAPLGLVGLSRIMRPLDGGPSRTVVTATVGTEVPGDLTPAGLFASVDTLVMLGLDGEPREGFRTVVPWELVETEAGIRFQGAEGAVVWVRDPAAEGRFEMFVPVGEIGIEVDEVVIPELEGPTSGSVRGRMSFESAGLVVEIGSAGISRVIGQVSDRTTRVFAEFDLVQRVRPLGSARTTITGGPLPLAETPQPNPQVGLSDGGLSLHAAGMSGDALFRTHLWLGEPGVGVFAVGDVDLAEVMDRSAQAPGRAWAWTESGTVEDAEQGLPLANLAFSTGGTVEITRYVAPGEETWGVVEGTLTVEEALAWGGAEGATQTVVLDFATPVTPTGRHFFVQQPTRGHDLELGPWHARVGNGPIALPGRVRETGIEPVAGVTLTLRWSGGTASVVSNDRGEFVFSGLHAGDYEVEIDVPDGYGLARGQRRVVGPLNLSADLPSTLPIALSDAEGNGALDVVATKGEVNGRVDGVGIRVRSLETGELVTVLTTGEAGPIPGRASGKLQPGGYRLEYDLPAGFGFREGQPKTVDVEIVEGRRKLVFVQVRPS